MLLCLGLQGFDGFAPLERYLYDAASAHTARQPSERIAIIALAQRGRSNPRSAPGSRAVDAQLIDLLAGAQAATIVHTTAFAEPQSDPGLGVVRHVQQVLEATQAAGGAATPAAVAELLTQAQVALDTDGLLAASMQRADKVLLPALFAFGKAQDASPLPLPDYVLRSTLEPLPKLGPSAQSVQSVQLPLPVLGQAAAGIGHQNWLPDADGVVRSVPLFITYRGRAVPSLALLAAAHSLGLDAGDIRMHGGALVQLGKLHIPVGDGALMWPQFYPEHAGKPAFAVDALEDVLSGKIAAEKYAGKLVIVDDAASGMGSTMAAPGYPALSPALLVAHLASSLLSGHFYVLPAWGVWACSVLFLVVAAYVVWLLPRLSASQAVAGTLLLVMLLLAAEYALLLLASLWIPLVGVAAAALLGQLALIGTRQLLRAPVAAQAAHDPAEANRQMGLALQAQGQLDLAFECFGRATMGEILLADLYALALAFEQQGKPGQALAVYRHMASFSPDYKDVLFKLARANSPPGVDAAVGPPATAPRPGPAAVTQLGRYQLEKELGRGAMGVVYQGRDPTIGRVVAVKTLALSQEFAAEDLTQVRERFFREAETAGRLQHPHIVTIFDAGEEHGLAFIAMEFLHGQDLTHHCRPGQLLPPATVVDIVARVAGALDFAHRQNVVHRDIKPANIMFDAATDSVKVTDFGIARITDSSKTKTGLVLGTPSFMSPEQLSGKKVDGRSDLYSLGVMLFQMLTGVLPFRADSMSELMYKITHAEPADIRSLRPELPMALADVVALALRKQPQTRYQTGEHFAADLQAAVSGLGALAVKTFTPAVPVGTVGVVGGADIEI